MAYGILTTGKWQCARRCSDSAKGEVHFNMQAVLYQAAERHMYNILICVVVQRQLSEAEHPWHPVAATGSSALPHCTLHSLVRLLDLEVHDTTKRVRWSGEVLRYPAEFENESAAVGGMPC